MSRQRRDHEFPTADSLARGMLFCTEPGPGKFLSAIGRRAQRRLRKDYGWLSGGIEAGAQWELLPEGAPAGRAHSGPPQHYKSTKHVDSYIPLSRNNITLYATELSRCVPPPVRDSGRRLGCGGLGYRRRPKRVGGPASSIAPLRYVAGYSVIAEGGRRLHLGHEMHTGTSFVPIPRKAENFALALKPLVF